MRPIVETGTGFLANPPDVRVDKEGRITAQTALALSGYLQSLVNLVNGNLTLGDGIQGSRSGNLFGQVIDVISPSVADTEFSVEHGLDTTPVGFIVLIADKACSVYGSSIGSWGSDAIFLKCNAASATLRLWVV